MRSFAELVDWLAAAGIEHRADATHALVELPSAALPDDGTVVLVWRARATVDVVHQFAWPVPDDASALLDAIARLNHALALPGVGIDHARRRAYVRVAIARVDGALEAAVLGTVLTEVIAMARDLGPRLRAVAEGELPAAAILDPIGA
ncbi:MAG: hypothetical protein K8W52_27945 [Deltaproteobacteria bacterium]|nr:hypothetical protein [Deltaproteobacteria bacterium]